MTCEGEQRFLHDRCGEAEGESVGLLPVAADGSRGVKTKWFLGDTTVTRKRSVLSLRRRERAPQPEPRITTLGRCSCSSAGSLRLNRLVIPSKSSFSHLSPTYSTATAAPIRANRRGHNGLPMPAMVCHGHTKANPSWYVGNVWWVVVAGVACCLVVVRLLEQRGLNRCTQKWRGSVFVSRGFTTKQDTTHAYTPKQLQAHELINQT